MARIRTIKPDAYKSDTLSACSPLARWMFAGLWTYCDDYGRGRNDVRLIKAELFPLDDGTTLADVAACLEELEAADGAVCTYEVGGKPYLHMPKWRDHQRVSHPTASKIPECPKHPREDDASDSGAIPERFRKAPESLRPERNREQGKGTGSGKGSARGKPATSQIPESWEPKPNHQEIAAEYGLDPEAEAANFKEHFAAKGVRYKDWDKAYRLWLNRSRTYLEEKQAKQKVSDADRQTAGFLERQAAGGLL